MANYWGRSGAPMIQPTKDEIRQWLREARDECKDERRRRERAELHLNVAKRTLGQLVLAGKIEVPSQKLGELVIRLAMEEEAATQETVNRPTVPS
jgi:hypothetical protein